MQGIPRTPPREPRGTDTPHAVACMRQRIVSPRQSGRASSQLYLTNIVFGRSSGALQRAHIGSPAPGSPTQSVISMLTTSSDSDHSDAASAYGAPPGTIAATIGSSGSSGSYASYSAPLMTHTRRSSLGPSAAVRCAAVPTADRWLA